MPTTPTANTTLEINVLPREDGRPDGSTNHGQTDGRAMSWQYWGQPVPRAWAARHKPVLARPPAITQPVPQSTAAHNAHVAKTQHHSLCAHFLVLCEIGSTVNRLDWGNRPDPLLFYRGVAIEATMKHLVDHIALLLIDLNHTLSRFWTG